MGKKQPVGFLHLKVGKNIRQLRLAKKLTLEDLAAKIGMDWAYLAQIERGVRNTTITTIRRISRALGIDPVDFFK